MSSNNNNRIAPGTWLVSGFGDEDQEDMITLLSPEEEMETQPEEVPADLPILPVKNTVLFPGVVIPITVGRQKSVKLVKKAYKSGSRLIGVVLSAMPMPKTRVKRIFMLLVPLPKS